MNGRISGPALAWFLAGLFFFAAELPAVRAVRAFYGKKEPFFSTPVRIFGRTLFLRNDSYGKGYFGASRNGGRKHKGVDILAPLGTEILAPKSGRVTAAFEDKGYGKYIEILHPEGFFSRYAHLSEIRVAAGDWVRKGQVIGLCGKSGNAANPHIRPHLHFEIRSLSEVFDPTSGLLDPSLKVVNQNLKK